MKNKQIVQYLTLSLFFISLLAYYLFNDSSRNSSTSSTNIVSTNTTNNSPTASTLDSSKIETESDSKDYLSNNENSKNQLEADLVDSLINSIDETPTPVATPISTIKTPKNSVSRSTEPSSEDLPRSNQVNNIIPNNNFDNSNAPANSNVGFLTRANNTSSETEIIPEPTPTIQSNSLPLVSGQSRGYAMLYMMHPKARPVVEAQVKNLIDANIQEVYISVLIDGTFSKDHPYLQSVLQRLNDAGRVITLEQYLISGPTMRRNETTPIETDFSKLDPLIFRTYDIYQDEMKEKIKKVAREARGSFEFNTKLNRGNSNYIAVMLEDNLDSSSYRYLRNIVSSEIGNTATFIRNPCPNCDRRYDSDAETYGDPLELHEVDQFPELGQGDGYTLDGVEVMYPTDESVSEVTSDDIKSMIKESYQKQMLFFGLWRKGSQGIGPSGQSVHPDNRNYIVPTEAELKVEIEILREGLSQVN
jgi:hypothetical protein